MSAKICWRCVEAYSGFVFEKYEFIIQDGWVPCWYQHNDDIFYISGKVQNRGFTKLLFGDRKPIKKVFTWTDILNSDIRCCDHSKKTLIEQIPSSIYGHNKK